MTADVVTLGQMEGWIRTFAEQVARHKAHLTDLDAAIGDADHGINMDRGMRAVVEALEGTGQGRPTSCSSWSA